MSVMETMVPTAGRLESDKGFKTTWFVALRREAGWVQEVLGDLACSPEGGYMLGTAYTF